MAAAVMRSEADRPIRVVVFGGAYFEPAALEFVSRLETHPGIDLVGGVCQSAGFGFRSRVADLVRRRGFVAPAVLAVQAGQVGWRCVRAPRRHAALRRNALRALRRFKAVPDIHAPAVLRSVADMDADLGLIYGSPILKPALFELPRFGTLGIHHGSLPGYRGKKTAFWAMYNGESTAGVTIQKINAGLDTGEIVLEGSVPIGTRRFGRVDAEVQQLGVDLYIQAIVAVRDGTAVYRPQPAARAPLCRQPTPAQILELWQRQLRRRLGWSA
jgi:methionyl-tRNA formyltransferase